MSITDVDVELIVCEAGMRRPTRSASPTVQVTVTETSPPGPKSPVSVLTLRLAQPTPSEPSAAVALCCAIAVAVAGSRGYGGRSSRLGSRAVEVEPCAGQAPQRHDEQKQHDKQRREEDQFGSDASRLVARRAIPPFVRSDGHGAPAPSVYCSVGPLAVAVTGKENTPRMLSVRPLTVTVVVSFPRVAVIEGPLKSLGPS